VDLKLTESLKHKELKSEGKQILIKLGFKDEEISVDKKYVVIEYHGQNYKFRPDVYGYKENQEKVVECGNFPRWKHPIYFKRFGEPNVLTLPYPPFYSRYNQRDLDENRLDSRQAKFFMTNSYNKYIYEEFKNDDVFEFQEFNEKNRDIFDCDNHRTFKEINPDYGKKKEDTGKDIWMNFPTSLTTSKDEYKHDIRFGMIYYGNNILAPTFFISGRDGAKKFTDLTDSYHEKIFDILKSMPDGFFIRSGWLFWEKDKMQRPFDKEYNDPIYMMDLTWEDYQDIVLDTENITNSHGLNIGPVLDLAKTFIQNFELTETIRVFKPLYHLLLKPKFKADEIYEDIKKIDSWSWYLEEGNYNDLYEEYNETSENAINKEKFRKACFTLKKSSDYKESIK